MAKKTPTKKAARRKTTTKKAPVKKTVKPPSGRGRKPAAAAEPAHVIKSDDSGSGSSSPSIHTVTIERMWANYNRYESLEGSLAAAAEDLKQARQALDSSNASFEEAFSDATTNFGNEWPSDVVAKINGIHGDINRREQVVVRALAEKSRIASARAQALGAVLEVLEDSRQPDLFQSGDEINAGNAWRSVWVSDVSNPTVYEELAGENHGTLGDLVDGCQSSLLDLIKSGKVSKEHAIVALDGAHEYLTLRGSRFAEKLATALKSARAIKPKKSKSKAPDAVSEEVYMHRVTLDGADMGSDSVLGEAVASWRDAAPEDKDGVELIMTVADEVKAFMVMSAVDVPGDDGRLGKVTCAELIRQDQWSMPMWKVHHDNTDLTSRERNEARLDMPDAIPLIAGKVVIQDDVKRVCNGHTWEFSLDGVD